MGKRKKTVAIIGSLDTKGEEFAYVKKRMEESGLATLMVDTGSLGEPDFPPDIEAEEVARAGGGNLKDLRAEKSRSNSNVTMKRGATKIIKQLHSEGKIDCVFTMGGGQGTAIAKAVMSALPIGFPKVFMSTLPFDRSCYASEEGINDTLVMRSMLDISGLNEIICMQIDALVAATIGLLSAERQIRHSDKPKVALSMLGITTPCVSHVQQRLEKAGYETFVFHATGLGGYDMVKMTEYGFFTAWADITQSETVPEVVNGYGYTVNGSAGPKRLTIAGEMGITQIVVPGGVDTINCVDGKIPEPLKNRKFHMHRVDLRVMRTTPEENRALGKIMAERWNKSKGKIAVLLPLRGVSANDIPGYYYHDPEANQALFKAIKENLRQDIPVIEVDRHINDPEFANEVADVLLDCLNKPDEAERKDL